MVGRKLDGMGRLNPVSWLAALLLWAGCAQVSSPTGGAVDEDPPQVLRMSPEAGTTFWSGGTVVLEFDEYVQVKNAREQWLISPPLDGLPTYRLRGRTLELDWSGVTLPESGTVVLDLGESVVDLHEGNPLTQGVWAAAIGAELDTLRWRGRVVHRDFAAPVPGVRVMLFPADWPMDSLVQGARPRYVGVTDAAGRFEVGYIAPGEYRTWAVEDVNKDWAWNPGESVAWDGPWTAGRDSVPAHFTLFPTEAKSAPHLNRPARDSSGVAAAAWSGPADLEHVRVTDFHGHPLPWWADADSVWTWGSAADTLLWTWRTPPTEATDTVPVGATRIRRSVRPRRLPSGKLLAAPHRTLRFSQPVAELQPAAWRIAVDSVEVGFDSLSQPSPFEVRWHAAEAAGVKYALDVAPGGITFASGTRSDTLQTQWETWPADHLAELVMHVAAPPVAGRLRLEDAAGRMLAERPLAAGDSVAWRVGALLPGKVELVWESDRYGTGRFEEAELEALQPGDVRLRAEGGVELRSNWTLEWIWPVESEKFPKLGE